jgi:hypothetical protein
MGTGTGLSSFFSRAAMAELQCEVWTIAVSSTR